MSPNDNYWLLVTLINMGATLAALWWTLVVVWGSKHGSRTWLIVVPYGSKTVGIAFLILRGNWAKVFSNFGLNFVDRASLTFRILPTSLVQMAWRGRPFLSKWQWRVEMAEWLRNAKIGQKHFSFVVMANYRPHFYHHAMVWLRRPFHSRLQGRIYL